MAPPPPPPPTAPQITVCGASANSVNGCGLVFPNKVTPGHCARCARYHQLSVQQQTEEVQQLLAKHLVRVIPWFTTCMDH